MCENGRWERFPPKLPSSPLFYISLTRNSNCASTLITSTLTSLKKDETGSLGGSLRQPVRFVV